MRGGRGCDDGWAGEDETAGERGGDGGWARMRRAGREATGGQEGDGRAGRRRADRKVTVRETADER